MTLQQYEQYLLDGKQYDDHDQMTIDKEVYEKINDIHSN